MKKIMKKLVLATILASFILTFQASLVCASADLAGSFIAPDNREAVLKMFLQSWKSPLSPYVAEFIAAADFYGLDWRLVPAITGVESSFGKQMPYNSYNAYGWANGEYRFKSWQDSIWHVSKTLRKNYVDRGVDTVWEIGRVYAPPSPFWSGRVAFFMDKIEDTSNLTLDL